MIIRVQCQQCCRAHASTILLPACDSVLHRAWRVFFVTKAGPPSTFQQPALLAFEIQSLAWSAAHLDNHHIIYPDITSHSMLQYSTVVDITITHIGLEIGCSCQLRALLQASFAGAG